MGRIDREKDGNLAVAIENEADAAQLRATIKASDGADEVPVQAGKTATVSADNPFNFFALWATDLMREFHDAFVVQVEYNSQEVVICGDWAFDRGTERYTLTPKAGGASIRKSGNYLYLYQRQEDGSWKQSRVIWN
jgi:hypothetical protein